MMTHPETYTMTRAEWLEINRTLADASLAISMPDGRRGAAARLGRVRAAQDIMSEIYQRAEKGSDETSF